MTSERDRLYALGEEKIALKEEIAALREEANRAWAIVDLRSAALRDAYETLDAACRWAAGETSGIRTTEDADRHIKGYDALLDGTVRAGKAAGVLR